MEVGNKASDDLRRRLKIGILGDILFSIAQFVIGISSGSLALISNGGHGLTDALSLLISFIAAKVSMREATTKKTYGYGRATIIAALINSVLLILFAIFVFAEAYVRILNPVPVGGVAIIVTAIFGMLLSGGIAVLLRKHNEDLNVKSVFLHMGYDAIAYVGTLLAGLAILVTRQTVFDPLISILIGILMIIGAWGVLQDAFQILLEGAPRWISVDAVRESIKRNKAVRGVHDLHIWAISSQYAALSCHVIIQADSLSECSAIISNIKKTLRKEFRIEHATIEAELKNVHMGRAHK
jgi:cobalt-zinc-cadmium efflux system protein